MTTATDSPEPRRSDVIRREVNAYRAAISDAARAGDNEGYREALAGLNATQRELEAAERREYNADEQERRNAKHAEAFERTYGATSVGELLARRLTTEEGAHVNRVNAAERTAAIAEHILGQQPTDVDRAAEALQRIRKQVEDAKNGGSTQFEDAAREARGNAA